jgi:phosphoserine phosphatase
MTSTEISQGLVIQGFAPPLNLNNFKLIAFDMDSTLINIECIDEIADAAGRKAEVAAITEAAMRRRLALLEGVSVASMEAVYAERLQINPGAKALIDACKAAGMKVLLVSGGFTFFADKVQQTLGIDYVKANVLEVKDGKLTGRLIKQAWGEICDGEEKRSTVASICADLGVTPAQAIAMGDGANDLPMMKLCEEAGGLSVAYHAKPKVRAQAMVAINEGGLDRLLNVFS